MHRTRERLEPLAGQWWKFTQYELKDGYICPAPDATLSAYDPWSEPSPGVDTAYASLANLVPRGRDAGDNGTVSPDTAAAALEWCQRYGLLGVLLQRVEKIVLQTWTEDERAILQEWNGTEEETDRYQIRMQFHRVPQGWETMYYKDWIAEGEAPQADPAGVMLHPHRRLGRDGLRAVRTDLGTVLSVAPPRSMGVLSLSEAAVGEVLGPLLRTG